MGIDTAWILEQMKPKTNNVSKFIHAQPTKKKKKK